MEKMKLTKKQLSILSLIKLLISAYKHKGYGPTEDAQFLFWIKSFEDLDINILTEVIQKIIYTEDFPPTIAMIRKECALKQIGPIKTPDEALKELMHNFSRYGRYDTKKGKEELSPDVRAVVDKIGYVILCDMTTEVMQRTFKRAYKEHIENKITDVNMDKIQMISNTEKNYLIT